MEDIYIKTDMLPEWLDRKYFSGTDLASIDDLISIIEDLDSELENIKEEYDDFRENVESNYKFVGEKEAVGYNESW